MKVAGQLENAGFEQLAADPAVSPTGRVYANIAAPAAAVLKYYDGTAWRSLQIATTLTVLSQNSGQAITIDWSKGLNQQVILTNNCLISFTNPQAGQNHRLVVTQKTYTPGKTLYQFKLNMADQDSNRGPYQPQGIVPWNDSKVFNWLYTAGIRSGYATVPQAIASPLSNVAEACSGIDISPDGKAIMFGRVSSPFMASQQFFDAGSRAFLSTINPINAPSAAAAKIVGVKYSPAQNLVFGVSATTPFLQSWTVADSRAQANFFANPGTLPAGAGQCLDVHPNGNYVICGHTTTPFMSAYPYDSAAFGGKLANPASLPVGQVNAVAFSPMGDYLVVGSATTPFIQAWPFDAVAGSFGTIIANPVSLPGTGVGPLLGKCIAWRPQGDYIAMADGTNIYVTGFNRITGAFTSSQLSGAFGASVACVQWTPDGQYLVVGGAAAPFLKVYDFSAQTLVNVTFDISAPAAQVNDLVIDPSGRFMLLALNTTPFVQGFLLPTKVRNYLRV